MDNILAKKKLMTIYISPNVIQSIELLAIKHRRTKSMQAEQMLVDAIEREDKCSQFPPQSNSQDLP
jgi:predicted transcriptional regulator